MKVAITYSEMVRMLKERAGVTFIGLRARTKVTNDRKNEIGKPRGQGRINEHYQNAYRLTTGNVTSGADYAAAAERNAARQGIEGAEFLPHPLPRPDDEWLVPGKVIVNQRLGRLYLRTETTPGQRDAGQMRLLGYVSGSGKEIAKDALRPFLAPPKESKRQQEELGVKRTIWVRDYGFDSILSFTMDGVEYVPVHDVAATAAAIVREMEAGLDALYEKRESHAQFDKAVSK